MLCSDSVPKAAHTRTPWLRSDPAVYATGDVERVDDDPNVQLESGQ